MHRLGPTISLLLALSFATAGCGPPWPGHALEKPVDALAPADLAGRWQGDDGAGATFHLVCRPDGALSEVIERGPEQSCRQVGWFWIEGGAFVVRLRTNDCDPDAVRQTVAYPIARIGSTGFEVERDGRTVRYARIDARPGGG